VVSGFSKNLHHVLALPFVLLHLIGGDLEALHRRDGAVARNGDAGSFRMLVCKAVREAASFRDSLTSKQSSPVVSMIHLLEFHLAARNKKNKDDMSCMLLRFSLLEPL